MHDFIFFALLGLGTGALYALASQGLMVIYRGSGVLSFAHGAIGMVGAYVEWEVKVKHHQPTWLAWTIAILICSALGALAHLLIMKRLQRASPLARIVVTLGMLIILQSIAVIRYGARTTLVKSEIPRKLVHVLGVDMTGDRFILLGIAAVMSAVLWSIYRYTKFGLATMAVAENQRAASSLGLSSDFVATANWALGSALACIASILISPLVQLQVSTMTGLVIAAMAAALVASFRSFPIALAAGLFIGVGQAEMTHYLPKVTGLPQAFPAFVIVFWMVIRGQGLPLRDFFLQRLPAVGTGRVRPGILAVAVLITGWVMMAVSPRWADAFVGTFAIGLVLLSIVVVTGYAGQLSLAQFAMAGFGALIAGRLIDAGGWPFPLALVAGVIATAALGAVFALPAVRARGINLAIVTLGLGNAIEFMVFNNSKFVGGYSGTKVGRPKLFGWDFNAITHPGRYGIVAMGFFVGIGLMVANVRRGRSGRRLIAVRTNERAAAALGISVPGAKVYAFALAAAIAAVGGMLLSFRKDVVLYSSEFPNFTSIPIVGFSVIGGIGYLFGPVQGATLAPGSLGAQVSNTVFASLTKYIPLIGGIILVLLVLLNQDGTAHEAARQMRPLADKLSALGAALKRMFFKKEPKHALAIADNGEAIRAEKVRPQILEVHGLTVRYGGVIAVNDVDFTVRPGHIVGLIGPNGAGKTSAIDAVTGFARATGRVVLDGHDVSELSVAKRARLGISRSFQSLELFEDSTVLDNLRAASDKRDRLSYLRDLVYPHTPPLPAQVVAAIREFRLEEVLDRKVQDLPYGQRRLLAIARAVATQPSVLLLDEPAAGLGDTETAELAHLVRRLADDWGLAVLLVEHDMNFVMSVCDEIVVLDFGQKIADGPRESVRNDPRVIVAYLGEEEDDSHDDHHKVAETV